MAEVKITKNQGIFEKIKAKVKEKLGKIPADLEKQMQDKFNKKI